jgi:CrcB protein
VNALLLIAIAAGGAVGAVGRHVISFFVSQKLGPFFPWGTLVANVLGCFLIGTVFELSERINLGPNARAMISIGLIGALTTFSTFAIETINLIREREWAPALLNISISIVAGLGACALGMLAVRLVTHLHGGR